MYNLLFIRPVSYLAVFFTMLLFEQLFPYAASQQKKSSRVAFHLSISVANTLILYAIAAWPISFALHCAQTRNFGISHFLHLDGVSEILAVIVVFDLWDYWMHRAFHRVPFLWRFHKAHHTDTEIDVTTAARFHIGELLISTAVKCLVILLWGPSLQGFLLFEILLNLSSEFHHSNVAIPFAIQDLIEPFILTPRMHRCHHALHRDCFNANFASILSAWDRVFGTYHHATDPHEMESIGLFSPRGPETMMLKPFLATPFTGKRAGG